LKRDVEQAASDRTIPLAGDESEQKRVNPTRSGITTGWKGSVTVGAKSAVQSQVPVAPSTTDTGGDQKADNGRVSIRTISATGREETTTIDIVRPAIPAAVIALLTRRESAGERAAQPGEGVVEDIGGGLTVVNSVSSLGEASPQQPGDKRKPLATQTAFFKVLVKGERMPPKPGRADDFSWPRPEAVVAPEPTPQPAAAKQQPPRPGSTPPAAKAQPRG
jgi:uncharacterized protein